MDESIPALCVNPANCIDQRKEIVGAKQFAPMG